MLRETICLCLISAISTDVFSPVEQAVFAPSHVPETRAHKTFSRARTQAHTCTVDRHASAGKAGPPDLCSAVYSKGHAIPSMARNFC